MKKEPTRPQTQFSPTGGRLTSDQLRFGYWFVSHKVWMRRIGILVFGLFDLLLIIYALYGFGNYYFFNRTQVQNMYAQLTSPQLNYDYLFENSQPQNLIVVDSSAIKTSDNRYDLVAQVQNFNESWYASQIVYHFEAGDFVTSRNTDYVLPGQVKYLMNLGQESEQALNDVDLIIDSIEWKKQANYQNLQDKILNIEISDSEYLAPAQSGLSDELQVSRVKFTAFNNSAYNFWDVDVKVLLYRANSLVAVNSIPYSKLDAGETVETEFVIYDRIATPNKIEIYPDVDILNPDSFKSFDGAGEAKNN